MRKNRPQLLEEFIRLLFVRDPMGLNHESNPDAADEYDGEALSILSRFVEAHLISMPNEDASAVAYSIVQSAFTFWFSSPLHDEAKAKTLAQELLDLYLSSYAEQETVTTVSLEP